jgi:hypothetical protein
MQNSLMTGSARCAGLQKICSNRFNRAP